MSDHQPRYANILPLKKISAVWIIPIIALIVGIWMFIQYERSQGAEITLRLDTAAGIEAGKTAIKSLNVNVGTITHIRLSDDYSSIIATAQMKQNAQRMLREDSHFWVVKPRISTAGISGLDTLLSGAYIELQPGSKGKKSRDFKVLDAPPIASPDEKGLRVVLMYPRAGKLSVGDPVLYDGFTVGRVERVSFDIEKKQARYQLFIRKPYDDLVRNNTRFWLTSGLSVALTAQGVNVDIPSLESLIGGGVTFNVPRGLTQGVRITDQLHSFTLYGSIEQVREHIYDKYIQYVMLFNESVRGLHVGAPVEFRGVRIGTVEKVPLALPSLQESLSESTAIPVLVRIELDRVYSNLSEEALKILKVELESHFQKGLRATLNIESLLTSTLFIDVDQYKETKTFKIKKFGGYPVFPTRSGAFTQIREQLETLLAKLNDLPLEDVAQSMHTTLIASEHSLKSLAKVTNALHDLLAQKETQSLPKNIHDSLQKMQKTLEGFDPNSASYQNIQAALVQFQQAMAELQPVLKQLNKKPNALIFGDKETHDPVPVKGVSQ